MKISFIILYATIGCISCCRNFLGFSIPGVYSTAQEKMAPKVEKVVGSVKLGEAPHWDDKKQCLYFVDIDGKSIYKYVPATKKLTKALIGINSVSLIIPVEGQDDKFVITIGRDLAIVTWDGENDNVSNIEKFYEIDVDHPDNRFNDGKCDASGRLWAGSMGHQSADGYVKPFQASFISATKKQVKTQLTKVGISNGLAWSLDNKYMYYIDTLKGTVDRFDFDIVSGTISNRQTVFSLLVAGLPGALDGMTIDTDGNLWIALFGGDQIIQIDPRRPQTLLGCVRIPAHDVTSLAFGGPYMDHLYVTSARSTAEIASNQGATFVVTGTGAKGFPGKMFKL